MKADFQSECPYCHLIIGVKALKELPTITKKNKIIRAYLYLV